VGETESLIARRKVKTEKEQGGKTRIQGKPVPDKTFRANGIGYARRSERDKLRWKKDWMEKKRRKIEVAPKFFERIIKKKTNAEEKRKRRVIDRRISPSQRIIRN